MSATRLGMFDELSECIAALFRRKGVPVENPALLAEDVVLELATLFGGRATYLPKANAIREAKRNAEIVKAIRAGEPVKRIAARLQLTSAHVYRVAGQMGLTFGKVRSGGDQDGCGASQGASETRDSGGKYDRK